MNEINYSSMLSEDVKKAENILLRYLPMDNDFQGIIFDSMKYSCMAGGKRLRPILMYETYNVFGGKTTVIEPFMAAIEMIHTYSLVHDDLPCMDNDEFRRGKKTTWSKYGEDFGVLCGDALLNCAFETAASTLTGDEPAIAGRALQILARKSGTFGMLGGQVVDVYLTNKPMNNQQLDFIYRLKTGALIEASMMIGAVLAGADDNDVELVERIASIVGMAFQIRDDILDITSTTEQLGKPVLSDEKNNKTTYVSLYGLDNAQLKVKMLMEEAEELLGRLPGDTGMLEYIFKLLVNREK